MATLPDLLPTTPYLIAYTLPLFLVSVVLTFAGAFLILDRTRRFSPRYDALPGTLGSSKGLKGLMVLEGGVGGLLLGYAFGVHLSTFLALIIPTTVSSSANLSGGAFVAVWLLSALTTTILCGRYSVAAISLAGISGGALVSLAICVIIHPPLSARVIFTAVVMCLLTLSLGLSSFIPALTRFKHPFLRFAASSVGAFGVTVSISLFSHSTPSWSDVWSHLYVPASVSWGTSAEKGLSALFCILLIVGAACDYLLWRKWGECPDEKWDNYLAEYATNLPNRAGTFHPFGSVWDRVFGHGHEALDTKDHKVIFPLDIEMGMGDADTKPPLLRYDTGATMVNESEQLSVYKLPPGLLKKGRRSSLASKTAPHGFRRKEPVKFRPVDEISSDEEDEGDEKNGLDYRKEMDRLRAIKRRTGGASPGLSDTENSGGPPDYSDFEDDDVEKESTLVEEDIAAPASATDQQWTPRFIQRHRSSRSHSSSSSPSQSLTSSQRTAVAPTQPTLPKPTPTPALTQPRPTSTPVSMSMPTPSSPISLLAPAPVPATPSLLNALDRVEKARREAFQANLTPLAGTIPEPRTRTSETQSESVESPTVTEAEIPIREEGRGQRWQDFWREVKDVSREKGAEAPVVTRMKDHAHGKR